MTCHKMLALFFFALESMHAESAICDVCRASSGLIRMSQPVIHSILAGLSLLKEKTTPP